MDKFIYLFQVVHNAGSPIKVSGQAYGRGGEHLGPTVSVWSHAHFVAREKALDLLGVPLGGSDTLRLLSITQGMT